MPVFFWNSGYSCLQEIVSQDGQCILQNTDLHPDSDVLEFLLESKREGIYILEGVLDFDESGQVNSRLGFQLANAYYHSSWSAVPQFWVMLESYIQLPMNLQPLIPVLRTPLPSRVAAQKVVELFCDRNPCWSLD